MQLSKNFTLSEFSCKDGTQVPPIYFKNIKKLAENLQVLRDEIKLPIRINSGYRTPAYNKKIGGAAISQHLFAKAADINVLGMSPSVLKSVIERLIKEKRMHNGAIGLYTSFVHYDIRENPVRFNGNY